MAYHKPRPDVLAQHRSPSGLRRLAVLLALLARQAADAIRPGHRSTVRSAAQGAAGRLLDLGDDLRGDRLEVLVRESPVERVEGHLDRDGLLAFAEGRPGKHVEHLDVADELAIGAFCRPDQLQSFDRFVDDEGVIPAQRLVGRQRQARLGAGRLLLGLRNAIEETLEAAKGASDVDDVEGPG